MKILTAFFRFVVGVIFGALAAMAVVPAAASINDGDGASRSSMVMLSVMLVGALLGVFAPTVRRAFGRGFLLLGAGVFLLPMSMLMLSGKVATEMVAGADQNQKAAAAIGSGIAGAMMTGASAFIGIIVGSVLLLIGLVLVLGGRREVIVVERR